MRIINNSAVRSRLSENYLSYVYEIFANYGVMKHL